MAFRIEKDTMGEVQVPADKYWAAQTERPVTIQNWSGSFYAARNY